MPFAIIYKHPFGDDFKGISLTSRTGSGYIQLYMERSNNNRLYLFSGYRELIDMFYLENGKEILIKTLTPKLITKLSKNVPVLHRLTREGESLLYKAYCLNGEYCFSFYDDDQNPFSQTNKGVNAGSIKEGFNIETGELYHVSYWK